MEEAPEHVHLLPGQVSLGGIHWNLKSLMKEDRRERETIRKQCGKNKRYYEKRMKERKSLEEKRKLEMKMKYEKKVSNLQKKYGENVDKRNVKNKGYTAKYRERFKDAEIYSNEEEEFDPSILEEEQKMKIPIVA